MKTKIRFVRNVTVDYYPKGEGDWQDRAFKKGEVLDLTEGPSDFCHFGNWADIVLPNGDLVESVPVSSFEIIP